LFDKPALCSFFDIPGLVHHLEWGKTITLENKIVDTGPILTAFSGSMARKEVERNIRYG